MACLLYERVICVNDDIASTLASLGIPEDHLETKPAFFPVDASTVPIPAEIEAWMNRHAPLISSTMFFRPEYGFDLLIRALAIVQRSHPKVGCVVIGSGEDRAEAETAIERFGMRDTVLLTGDVSHELCLQLMSRSSVFVRPTFCDGDSISVREAISLGVLVVGSNVGTRPEDTLLFEVGDIDGLVRQLENALMHGRSRGSIKM
jgi:glycosyltransferase involved in cell wall biosynthesis